MTPIGQTAGDRNTYVAGNGYNNAVIIFPYANNATRNITNYLTGNVNVQMSGNTDTPQAVWDNSVVDLKSGSRRGQGTIPALLESDADRLFQQIYNATHPLNASSDSGSEMVAASHKFLFNLYLWNSDEEDSNHTPTKYVLCDNCFFTTQPQVSVSNGTTNTLQPVNWAFSTTELSRHLGAPKQIAGLPN